jgi:hypothetical protein
MDKMSRMKTGRRKKWAHAEHQRTRERQEEEGEGNMDGQDEQDENGKKEKMGSRRAPEEQRKTGGRGGREHGWAG